ncbi:vWA domain-containing protein [Candidatus Eisenbacteria bacterium]|uniref:VWA domain-containing protein n=1 Tax=Eiseniibacteriota bacterium TaxID=2212470 RepID=A0ABV6YMB3_UNCEI
MRRLLYVVLLCCLPVSITFTASAGDSNEWEGDIPEATVVLESYPSRQATLTPDYLEVPFACIGDTFTEDKLLHLPAGVIPELGDILICFDLTGSMGGELNNVRNNAINIMNAVRAIIPDTRFGVISHMDYDDLHEGCDYSAIYGLAFIGDYPYNLDQPLTDDISAVESAINGLVLGDGMDIPEDYSRVLFETYNDAGIGWRPEAKKIVLLWGDAEPHDCAYDACIGGNATTGPDPGPDGVDNNADDLEILTVLGGMASANISLLPVYSYPTGINLWECYAALTGGQAWQINEDGTIPGGIDIADYIASIIGEEVLQIDNMALEVCTPGYESWMVSVNPTAYTDIVLDEPTDLPFTIVLTVPPGAAVGQHCFHICAIGDGAEYARQEVCITVSDATPVDQSTWGRIKNQYR